MRNSSLIFTSIVISVLLMITVMRACFMGIMSSMLCGAPASLSKGASFGVLLPNNAEVRSNTHELIDAGNRNREARKLMDGDEKTMAAPGSGNLDYTIALFNGYEIKQVSVRWGDYGINPNYIASWKLQASVDGSPWKEIASGASPHDSETVINKEFEASALRISAVSAKDWIGVYEVRIIGRPLQ